MSRTILDSIREQIVTKLPHREASRCCVGLSGGLDSMLLLDLLVALREGRPDLQVRAVHVDHGLDPSASAWAEMAQGTALSRDVPCQIIRVDVDRHSGLGLEAAARAARHAAFRKSLRDGEVLVTAHHADDQLETLLLALLRGSGVKGLASMPVLAPLARGWHWRPLLGHTRRELQAAGRERGIEWVEDPANLDQGHDRNYLRHAVLPLLRDRWPQAAQSAGRSAALLGEADALLESLAFEDLRRTAVGACLDVAALSRLPQARQRLLLRLWLQLRDVHLPSMRRLDAILRDVRVAAPDRNPVSHVTKHTSLRRYRGRLYIVRDLGPTPNSDTRLTLRVGGVLDLPGGAGRLSLAGGRSEDRAAGADTVELTVRFRSDGARVRVAGCRHSTALKELLRTHGVLPWMRGRVPLVFQGDDLLAIGDLPMPGAAAACPELVTALHWQWQPAWRAVSG